MSNIFELLRDIETFSNLIFRALQLLFYDIGPNFNSILQKLYILKQEAILKFFPCKISLNKDDFWWISKSPPIELKLTFLDSAGPKY